MASFVLGFDNLKGWCERQGLPFRADPESGRLAVAYKLLGEECPLLFVPHLDRGMLTLAMLLPLRARPERHAALMEALMLLNDNSHMGAWVLSAERGECYFRVTLPALDNEYSDEGLRLAARVVVTSCEAAAGAIKRVAEDADPRVVLEVLK